MTFIWGRQVKKPAFPWFLGCGVLILGLVPTSVQAQQMAALDFSQMTIEQLANVEVTTVSRQGDPLSKAPGAIYVITGEDVQRTGADSIPEMLRLAPNLQVAKAGSRSYGISARGFNQQDGTANKLLVMIDGRTIYSPLFSGTFWDVQNVLPSDIERIEVISGPGGALWGANAVNGVINIISKSSQDTQDTLLTARGGSLDQSVSLQHGGMIDGNTAFRIYGMAFQRGASKTITGADGNDAFNTLQSGFRADWSRDSDTLTLQGDMYRGFGQNTPGFVSKDSFSGGNVHGRWTRRFEDSSEFRLQAYYDKAYRQLVSGIEADVDTYDLDAQYSFAPDGMHSIVLGGGYRAIRDNFQKGPATATLIPASKNLSLASFFAQDKIALSESLTLTMGLKLENNSYTGLEYMPDARLAWEMTETDLLWASVSRAVRTPSRFDRELFNTGTFAGGPNFVSEELTAYEIGYRGQPLPDLALSVSGFYNVYDNLRTVEATTPVTFPLMVMNGMEGSTYGLEAWATYGLAEWWRLSAGASFLNKDLSLKPGSRDIFGVNFPGNDPDYQLSLRSSMNLGSDVTFDLDLRYIPGLPSPAIRPYIEGNARLGWRATGAIELFVMGSNLFHDRHAEFRNPSIAARQIPRSVSAGINWEF